MTIETDTAGGRRGRFNFLQEHPTETTTNYAGAVCLRCNLDAQSLVRVLPQDLFSSGTLPHLGTRPHWAWMETPVPAESATPLFLQPDDDAPTDASVDNEDIFNELDREMEAMFQDALNTGFYINEYTTKANVLGTKVLQGLRRASEKHMQDMTAAAAKTANGDMPTRMKQSMALLRKLVYMTARLNIQSGSEMAFPMLFGHLSFSTHRTWEMNLRMPAAKALTSWESKNSLIVRRIHEQPQLALNIGMLLPSSEGVDLPKGWFLIPDNTAEEKYWFQAPKGYRFKTLEAAKRHQEKAADLVQSPGIDGGDVDAAAPAVPTIPSNSNDGQAIDSCKASGTESISMVSANFFDDWMHRGKNNILSDMPWYMYAFWVYRAEKPRAGAEQNPLHVDIDFANHYKLSKGYVQRLSSEMRVPQPEGMSMPTEAQDPNRNGMYKSLLFRPFHQEPSDPETGQATDPFECLHSSCVGTADDPPRNPFLAFAREWKKYHTDVVVPGAEAAHQRFKERAEYPSLWETREVWQLLCELAKVGRFHPKEDMREDDSLGRVSIVDYCSFQVFKSAKHLESLSVARAAPRVRHTDPDKDAVDDSGPARFRAAHDGDDFVPGDDSDHGDDGLPAALDTDVPTAPADFLTDEMWTDAIAFKRERESKFVKDMKALGLLKMMIGANLPPFQAPSLATVQAKASMTKFRQHLANLPVHGAPDFDMQTAEQAAAFKERNTPSARSAEHPPPDDQPAGPAEGGPDVPHAIFVFHQTVPDKMLEVIAHVERPVLPGEDRKKVALTYEQHLAVAEFTVMVQTAMDEEARQVPWAERTMHRMILLGQGGTGKTMIVQDVFIPLIEWAFPPRAGDPRYLVVAFSHAQADAISNSSFRAKTLHSVSAMRVQSLDNKDMAPGPKLPRLQHIWEHKVCLVIEEVSMMAAVALNMGMYRATWGRKAQCQLSVDAYGTTSNIFGRVPIVLLLGDFLQLKPPNATSLADDLMALAREGRRISVEVQTACAAFHGIDTVIELTATRRFTDAEMPALMNFCRSARPGSKFPAGLWRQLSSRRVEQAQAVLETDNFANGYVMGIYWENVARSMVERAHRDAKKLDVPLIVIQAADRRPLHQQWRKGSDTENRVVHQLLTAANVHKTGHLHGLFHCHEGMRVRLLQKLSAADGLVSERQGTIVHIDLHVADQASVVQGYQRVKLKHMPHGIWVRFDNFAAGPMRDYLQNVVQDDLDDETEGLPGELVYVQMEKADFKLQVHLPSGEYATINVSRWQFPLTHAMVRTAQSSQGLTFKKGVLVDLRRAGGMPDDIWWLNVYVMLSRATCLKNLIVLGLTDKVRVLLERGPPTYLLDRLNELNVKARRTARLAVQHAATLGLQLPPAT